MKRLLPALFVFVFTFSHAQWTQLNGPPGGYVSDVERIASSGKLYAVVSSNLFESTNNGVSWQKTTITTPSNFNIDDLTINPTTGKMYAVNYSTLWTSTDGTNWTAASSGQFYGMYKVTRFGPDGFLAVSGWNGVYVSKDDGVTWTKILDEDVIDYNRLRTNSAGDLFAPTRAGIKRYLYPGASGTFSPAGWTNVFPLNLVNYYVYEVTMGVDPSNNIYAQVFYYNGSRYIYDLFRSTAASNGTTWTSIVRTGIAEESFNGPWFFNGSSIYYVNNQAGKIYSNSNITGTSSFSLTGGATTNGSTFITITSVGALKVGDRVTGTNIPDNSYVTQILNSTSFYINNPATATGTSITVTVTTLTSPWTITNSPSAQLGSDILYGAFASSSSFFFGSTGDGVFYTTNGGTTYSQGTGINFGNGSQVEVANTTGRILYLNNYQTKGYWSSTDNGSTWTFNALVDYVRRITKLGDGSVLLWGNSMFRSGDNGATFSSIAGVGYLYDVAPHPTTGTKVYSTDGSTLRTSTNSGATWSTVTVTGLPSGYAQYLAVNSSDEVYMTYYTYSDSKWKLYKISAGTATLIPGAPWLSREYFYPNNLFIQGGKVYVSSYDGIYSTADDGGTWSTSNFSGDYVFPITQGSYSGIAISRYGTLYVTQDDGKSFNSVQLPNNNSFVTDLGLDLTGKFIASANNSPALKYTGNLTVNPATLPAYIDFNWQPTNGPYGGAIGGLQVDNSNNVYALSRNENSYYKANLTVTSWTKLNFPPGYSYTEDMILKKSSGTLYSMYWDRIFSSADGGANWALFNSESITNRNRIMITPSGVMYMVADNNIYATAANGNTFGASKYTFTATEQFSYWDSKMITTSTNVALILVTNPSDNYKQKFKRSTDNGTTWTDVAIPDDQANEVSVDNSGNIYLVNWGGIYKSTDNGTTWTSIKGDITTGWEYRSKVAVSASNELYFPVTTSSGVRLKKSVNGGTNWTDLGLLPAVGGNQTEIRDITWQGTKMILATRRGIFTSTDGGLTFTENNTGITNVPTSDLYLASQTRLLVGVGDGTSNAFKSEDKGNTWQKAPYVFRQFFDHPDGSLIGLVADGNKAYRSIDAGATWLLYASFSQFAQQYFTPNGTDHYIKSYSDIYYSTNLTSWTKLNISGLPDSNNRFLTEIAADNNGILYVTLYNYQSNKEEAYQVLFGSGVALNQVTNPRSVKFHKNKIYLYGGTGTLATTSDGSTWSTKSVPSGDKFIIATKDYYFIPQYGGVLWLSRNLGDTWQSVGITGADANNFYFNDVVVNEYDGYAYAIISNSPVRKSANIVIPDDATNPVVATLSPLNNATGVSTKPKLTLTFDEGVIPQSGKTLRILDVANPVTPIETIDITSGVQVGKSFSFSLTNFLEFNKTYFVVVDAGAYKDVFGNSFAGILNNTTWRFTTKAEPSLSSRTPAHQATNVALTPTMSLTFTEKMGVGASKNLKIYAASNLSSPVESINLTLPALSEFALLYPGGNSSEQSVKLYFNAAAGGGELKGATKVYAHMGVVTSGPSGVNWTYYIGNWGADDGVGQMTQVPGETDIWELNLAPTVRQFFNVPTGTNIYRVAVVFRNANGTVKAAPPSVVSGGTVAENGDLFLNLGAGSSTCNPQINRNNSTINIVPCSTLGYQTQYVVKLDDGAITTIEGKPITGLLTGNTDWTFTTKAAPTVTTLAPALNATNVALNTTLAITFSEPMTAVASKNISIYKVSQPASPVATLLTTSGVVTSNTVTFTLASPLEYQTQYFVKLDDGAFKSAEGVTVNYLNNNTSWLFTTKEPPTITTLAPAHNATNVALNTTLAITFSETMTAVEAKNIGVYKVSQPATAVATMLVTSGAVTSNTITFTLASPLEYQTQYFVKLDDGAIKFAEGVAVNYLNTNTSWLFTTVEAPDTQKPAIVFTSSNLEKGVAKTFEITVNDNKPLPTDKTKIFYRKITDLSTAPFATANMTAGAGSGTVSSKFTIAAQESWYDAMGMEFYFETEDAAGNKERSPSTATNYHYSYISYTNDNTYPLLNPVLSFGGNQNNYRIITIPYKLSTTSISTILNEVGGGVVDKTQWRVFTLGASNAYTEPTTFTQGKGYWINIRTSPGNIKIEGSSSPEYNKSSFYSMALNPGWNMIGNPYPVDISWEETRAGNSGVGKVKIFNGTTYTDGDVLKSMEGGFVNVTGSAVNLKVRFKGITSGGRMMQDEIGSDLAESNWMVPIRAINNDITNALGGVGMHEQAKSGWDDYDNMNPPRFLDAAELAFDKKNEDVKKLARDIVPTQEEYVWDLNVETSDGITWLQWDNERINTNGKELMLMDVSRQKIVDMKAEGTYAFDGKEGNSFKIFFGVNLRNKIRPTQITLSKPYPNPMAAETSVAFTLPEKQSFYQTQLEVYNTMGQRIAKLVDGNYEPGFYSATWNPADSNAGLYFFRLTVWEDGTQKIITEKVVVNR
jgi:hypothetical protein